MMRIRILFCVICIVMAVSPFAAFGQQIMGACCHPDGSCFMNFNENDCEEGVGAIWLGEGTVCQPNPCPQLLQLAVPAFSGPGMILFMMLAGLGAICRLRRTRRA